MVRESGWSFAVIGGAHKKRKVGQGQGWNLSFKGEVDFAHEIINGHVRNQGIRRLIRTEARIFKATAYRNVPSGQVNVGMDNSLARCAGGLRGPW
jgi:hypothetical protein